MARRTPPFNALYAFAVTARHLNFTHAAKELFVTQGAVSRQISTLEDYLGFAVFDRHARGLSLTQQGKELLPEVQGAFEQLLAVTDAASEKEKIIRLKAPTCSMRWLIPKLIRIQQEKPHIRVALTTTEEHDVNFRTENFDVGLVFSVSALDEDNAFKLFDEEISPVIAPHLYENKALFSQHFQQGMLTLIHPTLDQTDWSLWFSERYSAKPQNVKHQYFSSMELAMSAAMQGLGITVADIHVVSEDVRMGRLKRPFTQSVKTGAGYYLTHRPGKITSPMVKEFINWLKQQ